jgi:hypothetical protein
MFNKLNYTYISMFLSIRWLFHSANWDVGRIIPLQVEFSQHKFIPQCFYCVKYIINVLTLILQVIMKLDCKPHWRGTWFGFCLSHLCSLICVTQHQKCSLPGRTAVHFHMFYILCINRMCKVFLKRPTVAFECINVI